MRHDRFVFERDRRDLRLRTRCCGVYCRDGTMSYLELAINIISMVNANWRQSCSSARS